jgi:hypothetical protein
LIGIIFVGRRLRDAASVDADEIRIEVAAGAVADAAFFAADATGAGRVVAGMDGAAAGILMTRRAGCVFTFGLVSLTDAEVLLTADVFSRLRITSNF